MEKKWWPLRCEQEQHDKCANSALCHLCDGMSLYLNHQEIAAEKTRKREERKEAERNALFRTHKKEKKEGMAFEKAVQSKWNQAYSKQDKSEELFKQSGKKTKIQKPRLFVDEEEDKPIEKPVSSPYPHIPKRKAPVPRPKMDARRQANSGATWHSKGDIITEEFLMECKERGTVNARGEKTITIPKEWLTKQEREAMQENKPYWLLPFHYKGDDTIYVIKSFDQEIEMYQEIRQLREQIKSMSCPTNL